MVGVDPAYLGQGIARQLIHQCLQQARANGEQTIGLHTSEKMVIARQLYETLGFEIVRELPPIFGMRYWLYAIDISGS